MNHFIKLEHVSKSYGRLPVLSDFSAEFTAPGIYCLLAPSGAGKTTLFRLIMGLETPDGGQIRYFPEAMRFSAVFQEDRLIEHLSPSENILLVLNKKNHQGKAADTVHAELSALLPEESLSRPVYTLSGGMKRRCDFLRAMMASSDAVIMDEPFTGLDEETKSVVIDYLLAHREERLFLIATHNREDIKKLGAAVIHLDNSQH